MATMKDVARLAGVSTATVSAVLNGDKSQASTETADRVQAAVHELGYVLNPIGRNLRKQETRMWTLTVPSIENPFITQVIHGVEDVARAAGYSLLLGHTQDDPVRERDYLRAAAAGLSDGVIIAPTSQDIDVSFLHQRKVPVISIVRPLSAETVVDTVMMDNVSTARTATRFLIDRGHRRIAYLAGGREMYADRKRLEGYRAVLESAGIPFDPALVTYTAPKVQGGIDAVLALEATTRPDALIVANSLMTIGVIEALRTRFGSVQELPEIVAFDDAPWTRPLLPFIHVIEQPAYELGRRAAQLLLDRLRSPQAPIKMEYLPAKLRPALE